jgi:arsenate reductase|tara:strand:- start:355 stop:654 length:300 start_codon:yes stop_codon:yes gene_type:complete
LQLLRDSNIDPNIVNYLTEPLNVQLLKSISKKLGVKPSTWIRKNENEYKINNINEIVNDDDQLYLAMIKFPKIIERPIVTRGNSAIIGRPPESVMKLID